MSPPARTSVLCVVGTRPEAIKMAPIVRALRRDPDRMDVRLVAAGQHREMLHQVFRVFGLAPDVDWDLMQPNQTLTDITSSVLQNMSRHLEEAPPDLVLAQGDTTTVMATAMACFYHRVRFGHVEAGLRTGNRYAPYPEEFNRRVAGIVGDYHFAPTPGAAGCLVREGTPRDTVFITGNPVIDALHMVLEETAPPAFPLPEDVPYVLMTCHRREHFGDAIEGIFQAVRAFASDHPDLIVWYPVHPNPHVRGPAYQILSDLPNVVLDDPLDYVGFAHAMRGAQFILSDSGGVQEEAPALGKPVLVLRESTERPEGVEAGACRLVGAEPDAIRQAMERLVDDRDAYRAMAEARNPYGDGRAAERIRAILAGDAWTPWGGA